MTIYLIRHGQTDWNVSGQFQGFSDIELNERGREEARWARKALSMTPLERIYCSDLSRAKETASIIGESHDLEIEHTERFRECNFGAWEGLTFEEIQRGHPEEFKAWGQDNVTLKSHGGESTKELQERVIAALDEVAKGKEEAVSIVCHAGVIKAILCHILGMDLRDRYNIEIDNASITKLETKPGGYRVLYTNHSLVQMEEGPWL